MKRGLRKVSETEESARCVERGEVDVPEPEGSAQCRGGTEDILDPRSMLTCDTPELGAVLTCDIPEPGAVST